MCACLALAIVRFNGCASSMDLADFYSISLLVNSLSYKLLMVSRLLFINLDLL
jgi:hypothetical protein